MSDVGCWMTDVRKALYSLLPFWFYLVWFSLMV